MIYSTMFLRKDGFDKYIEVPNNKWLTQIEGMNPIPTNSIIYKTKPGMGATFGEILAERHSIIILPHVSIIKNKHSQYKDKYNTFAVYGDGQETKFKDIVSYICNTKGNKKFLTTPRGLEKIKTAILSIGENQDPARFYSSYFLLIDECHKWVKDTGYRDDMIPPMDDFFQFKNKAMVSATAIPLSDERFKLQSFEHTLLVPTHPDKDYKCFFEQPFRKRFEVVDPKHLKFTHPFKKDITILRANSIINGLREYLEQKPVDNYCIFLNSIEGIKQIIEHLNIKDDSRIYCSAESRIKLNLEFNDYDVRDAFDVEDSKQLKKFTFFTSSFYAGLDIKLCTKPNIIIITDVYGAPYSITDPYTDVLQIIGRFRGDMYNEVVHLVDYTKFTTPLSEEILNKRISDSKIVYTAIENLKSIAYDEDSQNIYSEVLFRVYPYAKFIDANGNYSAFKEDNYRDLNRVKQYYSEPINLLNAYEETKLYNVSYDNEIFETKALIRLKKGAGKYNKANVLMASEALEEIQMLRGTYLYAKYRYEIRQTFPEVVSAFDKLEFNTLKSMEFRMKPIRQALMLRDLEEKKVRLPVDLVFSEFFIGQSYALSTIKDKFKKIYKKLNIPAAATGAQISNFFVVKPCKKMVNGKQCRAFHLVDYKVGSNPAYARR